MARHALILRGATSTSVLVVSLHEGNLGWPTNVRPSGGRNRTIDRQSRCGSYDNSVIYCSFESICYVLTNALDIVPLEHLVVCCCTFLFAFVFECLFHQLPPLEHSIQLASIEYVHDRMATAKHLVLSLHPRSVPAADCPR